MIKIYSINIKRFRSINDLTLDISDNQNIVTICGQNNVGKTNVLRAVSLFFGRVEFNRSEDVPEFKQMTGGASVYPNITIGLIDKKQGDKYQISQDYNPNKVDIKSNLDYKLSGKKNRIKLSEDDCLKVLKSINFFFLPAINISFPETINYLIDDKFLDIEFGNSKMRGKKGDVKKALETAKNTLQAILDDLTESINPSFKEFHDSWGIKFVVPKKIDRFREVINNEIDFVITDDTKTEINSKGAGLQRLGHILLNFRIIEKLIAKRRNCIVLIDEPDIYLHNRLQKLLFKKTKELSQKSQIFITTHSPLFINPYRLENLFLLELKVEKRFSTRKNQEGNVLETSMVDMTTNDSVFLVKETLGIEDEDALLVGYKNIIVEGGEDKIYLTELAKIFDLPSRNLISANGVTNFTKLLDYYNAITEDFEDKPEFKVIYDNDEAGRIEYSKLIKKNYQNIIVDHIFIHDAFKTVFPLEKPNIEIEDFIYPELILELTNSILGKRNKFKKIVEKTFFNQINNQSLRYNGVLHILENLKNQRNSELGLSFSTKDSGFKGGLAGMFSFQGNSKKIAEIIELDKKYPAVKEFLVKIFND